MISQLMRTLLYTGALAAVAFLAAACGGVESNSQEAGAVAAGDPVRGEALYRQTVIGAGSAPGCITCHSLDAEVTLVGPSHAGLASKAAEILPGTSARNYLEESIIDPDAHITEGFSEGVMYPNYGKELSDQEVADLVAYLLTLE